MIWCVFSCWFRCLDFLSLVKMFMYYNQHNDQVSYGMWYFFQLFAASFPLAPLLALLLNAVDMRIDAWRMLWWYQRPMATIAEDIGKIILTSHRFSLIIAYLKSKSFIWIFYICLHFILLFKHWKLTVLQAFSWWLVHLLRYSKHSLP